ncbi:hypothetical protein PQU92_09395 [Asticcacaulis sp. BYS171W]|uniref:VWFA domain-containing protein n=1 Tax=Asticcacaulis aquaticus TaxID=2984212 RepID=A0ABT5HTX7_9CAUL|nr:hypothetical protein [Asticcacaulis aquaticus]MDC7683489.1 hypothetical protein [Asticcacaulis aquaticus]
MKLRAFLAAFFRRETKPVALLPLSSERPAASESYAPYPYKAFTTQYDRVVEAADLGKLLTLDAGGQRAHDEAWEAFETGLQGWRVRLSMAALEVSGEIRELTSETQRHDTVITLLVDQSGSMKGQNLLMLAGAVDAAQDFLSHLNCKVELLGFTTRSWQGGQSRKLWQGQGMPKNPGRLCDLLHVIYKSADDDRSSALGYMLKPMFHPLLLKENVDGEAIQWAMTRLTEREESRKHIVVISDGAPVDDSTLDANGWTRHGHNILSDHLTEVITSIENHGIIGISAIGIGHDVSGFYRDAISLDSPDDLGTALLSHLKGLLLNVALTRH